MILAGWGAVATEISTAAELELAFRSSVATARRVYSPVAMLVISTEYGGAVLIPKDMSLPKNSTCFTKPSESDAAASMATLAPVKKVWPLTGFVIVTEGGTFPCITTTLTIAGVEAAPLSSTATALIA